MSDSEMIQGMLAAHQYPVDAEQLAGLELMYPSIRAGVEAFGALLGTSDVSPSSRFSARPDHIGQVNPRQDGV